MDTQQLFSLTGKVALVTGGSRGIGLQMALGLGGMGAKVAISARKPDELAEAAATLRGAGIETLTIVNDLSGGTPEPAKALVDGVLQVFGGLDILVNNAGTIWGGNAEDFSAAGWRKVMDLNLDACFFLAQEAARRIMIPRRAGKIINIASIAGLRGGYPPEYETFAVAYSVSKGALISLTQALATEWGRHNINVNAICPGYFPSKLSEGLKSLAARLERLTPLGRLGGEDELQGAVAFLASEASRHVTGQCLAVDGGSSVTVT